jgi:hypothetical protein
MAQNADLCIVDESWTVHVPSSCGEPLRSAAADLIRFFKAERRIDVGLSSSPGGERSRKTISIHTIGAQTPQRPAELTAPESFLLEVNHDFINVTGIDDRGAMYGALYLEDAVRFGGTKGLRPSRVSKAPRFRIRAGFDSLMRYGEEEMAFLARTTVNTFFLHGEPYIEQLTPSDRLPHDGDAIVWRQEKIDEFNRIFKRAKKWGMDCYTYARGTRSIPQFSGKDEVEMRPFVPDLAKEIFRQHPDVRGSNSGILAFGPAGGMYSNRRMDHKRDVPMCFSSDTTREFLRETCRNLFTHLPDLDGLVVLTTDGTLWCDDTCPRCRGRSLMRRWAEYVNLLLDAARTVKPSASIIFYGWGLPTARDQRNLFLSLLHKDVIYMGDPLEGAEHVIDGELFVKVRDTDSSIAVEAVGDIYLADVDKARRTGHRVINLQTFCRNNDFSYVPYVPAPYAHIHQITETQKLGLDGWLSLDGTGLNPAVTCEIGARWGSWEKPEDLPGILEMIASRDYGVVAAAAVLAAWRTISDAVVKSPAGAYHLGPFLGRVAKYPLILHDNLRLYMSEITDMWCSVDYTHFDLAYIRKVLRLYARCRDAFARGLQEFEGALALTETARDRANLQREYRVARACLNQLKSSVNFLRYVFLLRVEPGAWEEQSAIISEEIECARELLQILEESGDPQFGFNPFWGRTFVAEDVQRKIEIMERDLERNKTRAQSNQVLDPRNLPGTQITM